VKAFRLLVNRSVTWATWDEELFTLELQELNEADFDFSLTGFDPKEIDIRLVVVRGEQEVILFVDRKSLHSRSPRCDARCGHHRDHSDDLLKKQGSCEVNRR